jgi:hypothetical protein
MRRLLASPPSADEFGIVAQTRADARARKELVENPEKHGVIVARVLDEQRRGLVYPQTAVVAAPGLHDEPRDLQQPQLGPDRARADLIPRLGERGKAFEGRAVFRVSNASRKMQKKQMLDDVLAPEVGDDAIERPPPRSQIQEFTHQAPRRRGKPRMRAYRGRDFSKATARHASSYWLPVCLTYQLRSGLPLTMIDELTFLSKSAIKLSA